MRSRLKMDRLLFLTVLALACFGLVMVYSASSVAAELRFHTKNYYFFAHQAAALILSLGVLIALSQKDYQWFQKPQIAFGGVAVVVFLLILVYFVDSEKHRWFRLGVSIQPSEFAKPALLVFLAWFVALRKSRINSLDTVRPAALTLAAVAGAVLIADFGTAIVLVAAAAVMFYVAGLNWRYTVSAMVLAAIVLAAAVVAKPYRLKRVLDFVDPQYKVMHVVDPQEKLKQWADRGTSVQDTGYHALQSRLAVGAGGLSGRGLMKSRQKLLFLPEPHTDFIYAVIAEELGLWGAVLVLTGFFIILWRGLRLFWTAEDDFGRYLALGITTMVVFQALLNISVVLDLGPTKGLPLPLISFGGSSLLSTMILMGLLLSISQRAHQEI